VIKSAFAPLSRNYSCGDLGIGGWNNRESQLSGLFVEQGYLLLAVLLFVELLAPVDVFLSFETCTEYYRQAAVLLPPWVADAVTATRSAQTRARTYGSRGVKLGVIAVLVFVAGAAWSPSS
jgi:hypothetical protein